jgi:hypothetical protein
MEASAPCVSVCIHIDIICMRMNVGMCAGMVHISMKKALRLLNAGS